jgi:hypothetical protein
MGTFTFAKSTKSLKVIAVLLAALLALSFMATVGDKTAQAAQGNYMGLGDINTFNTQRPNTLDVDMGEEIYGVYLLIAPFIEDASGLPEDGVFPSALAADPSNFTWTQNTPGMSNVWIEESTGTAVPSGSGGWYYQVEANYWGLQEGLDSWKATYSFNGITTDGDFSFVATDYLNQDPGTPPVSKVEIEFHDVTLTPSWDSKRGVFTVLPSDDYAPSGTHGRSYATAMDAVGRAFGDANPIIGIYTKPPFALTFFPSLDSVTDLNNTPHSAQPSVTGWFYAVYTDNGSQWVRNPVAVAVAPDDYMLQDADRVVWKLASVLDYYHNFDTLFPPTLPLP